MDDARMALYLKRELTGQSGNVYITLLWPTYTIIDLRHLYSNIQISNLEFPCTEPEMIKKKKPNKSKTRQASLFYKFERLDYFTPKVRGKHPHIYKPPIKCSLLCLHSGRASYSAAGSQLDWRTACCTHWAVLLLPLQRLAELEASSSISLMSRYTELAFSTQPSGRICFLSFSLSPFLAEALCKFNQHLFFKTSHLRRLGARQIDSVPAVEG